MIILTECPTIIDVTTICLIVYTIGAFLGIILGFLLGRWKIK